MPASDSSGRQTAKVERIATSVAERKRDVAHQWKSRAWPAPTGGSYWAFAV